MATSPGAGDPARGAGVVVSLDGERYFVPAEVAQAIVQRPVVTPVPGTTIGMALIGGRVVTVIDVGARRDELLLCEVENEPVALSGLSVHGSGFYEIVDGKAQVDDELVPEFDVKEALVEAELGVWSMRQRTRDHAT